jgi:hypothetical protein
LTVLGWIFALLAVGFLAAIGLVQFFIRNRLDVDMTGECLVLRLPLLGEIETGFRVNSGGLRTKEAEHVLDLAERLGRLIDFDVVMDYAGRFDIGYIGFEGDMPGGGWTPGRLGYSTLHGGFTICLNPHLDLPVVARELSKQLRRPLLPEDVYPFLFFHEVGHSTRTGNQCYITALVNNSLSGGRRAVRRRRELSRLHTRIERYADEFGWRELVHYRARLAERGRTPKAV